MCVLCRALGSELEPLWHSSATAVYDGSGNEAPVIGYANRVSQAATGNQQVDGMLSGSKWSGTLTYSFTDSANDYANGYGSGEQTSGFAEISATEKQILNNAFAYVEAVTNLNIQRNDEAGISDGAADIRVAKSSEANPTAYAYYPSNSPLGEGGDIWIGTSYGGYSNPVLGNYAFATHIHELGHALGLKHSQESGGVAGAVPSNHDALEFTVMSYRSYIGGPTSGGYTNESFGYPQSYMMNDILALQKMYGADFGLNSGDNVYTWNASTGRASVGGGGRATPGANRVFLTIWDGNGNDTYDMSNYAGGVTINLQPGLWSTTSSVQKANLGNGHYAQGNVYNAYQFDGDARSLIENAIGGNGNDSITGNSADNRLDGGRGNDTLSGSSGDDLFVFHADGGKDIITDFTAGGAVDEIYFEGFLNVGSFSQAMAFASQVGANTLFSFATNLTLTLSNVTLGNLTPADFTFSNSVPVSTVPPTDIALSSNVVAENVTGATIGTVSVTDPDGETSFTFTLSDSRFQIVNSAGTYLLQLKNGVALDFETAATINIDITATDDGGFSRQETFIINVQDGGVGFTINGSAGNDTVDATTTVAGQQLPGNDADTINGLGGSDSLSGLAGDDKINGGVGNDFLYGGEGNDTFVIAGTEAQSDVMLGGTGNDTLRVAGTKKVTLDGFSAANSIEAWIGNNQAVVGTNANNTLDFSGLTSKTGMLFIDGGVGNDKITGSLMADDLRGGDGNDRIDGGGGNDLLSGGAGADTFIFSGDFGNDKIKDFAAGAKAGHDFIVFDDAQFANFADVMSHAAAVGTSVVITLDADHSITLQSMTLSKLVADDFQFV